MQKTVKSRNHGLVLLNFPSATTPGQSGPGSGGNEGVPRIPQSCSITGTSPSDCSVSYQDTRCRVSYPSAEKQSVYSTAPEKKRRPVYELIYKFLRFVV